MSEKDLKPLEVNFYSLLTRRGIKVLQNKLLNKQRQNYRIAEKFIDSLIKSFK